MLFRSDRLNWEPMIELLRREGRQAAIFTYPSDQPIAESAAFFATKMTVLRKAFPAAEFNLLGYSMGGLVCRAYVEGDDYAGAVERLILVGTPNTGSAWSRVRYALELQEHYRLWRDDPRWRPTWMITDGLGEAGRDLRPGSRFLRELNARPRREGVKYTIVCGDQSPMRRKEAELLDRTAAAVPGRAADWWGVRQIRQGLIHQANRAHNQPSAGDGAVSIERARLDGVADTVIVHADHARLYLGTDTEPPAAWDTIRDRLAR